MKEDLFLIIAVCVLVMVGGLSSALLGVDAQKERAVKSTPLPWGRIVCGPMVWMEEE